MIQIFHNPLNDIYEPQIEGYNVLATIDDLSQMGLVYDDLKVFWKNNSSSEFVPIQMSICNIDIPDCYQSNIPPQQEDTDIQYFITAQDYSGRYDRLPIAGYYDFSVVATQLFNSGDINMDLSLIHI